VTLGDALYTTRFIGGTNVYSIHAYDTKNPGNPSYSKEIIVDGTSGGGTGNIYAANGLLFIAEEGGDLQDVPIIDPTIPGDNKILYTINFPTYAPIVWVSQDGETVWGFGTTFTSDGQTSNTISYGFEYGITYYHDITFNANGGKVNGKAAYSVSARQGSSLNLPTPTRLGYIFEGWYDALSGGSRVTKISDIRVDKTYYARWKVMTKTQKAQDVNYPVAPLAPKKAPAVKASKKAATVTVTKTKGATSYKIRYREGKGKWKTAIVKKAGKKEIKKLKKGKKYEFQIANIKKVGKKSYVSKWSKGKKINIK
jgi:uncharacterized repeat protein (TIGR02543 family)